MNKLIIIMLSTLVLLAGCKKNDTVSTPIFDVTVDKTTHKPGEDVVFSFTGNPDIITLFSGEPGYRYEYLDRNSAAGIPKLQFTSTRANGTQAGSLALLVSPDFSGISADTTTTKANIARATWTDITSRATLSTGTAVSSGVIDLSDIAAGGKPVYLGFKYMATSGSIQNKWTIGGLTLTNTLPDATVYTLANLGTAAITNYSGTTFSPGWVGYRVSNNYNWVITAGTSLVITGATTAATATAPAESWTFSGPIDLRKVVHDAGLQVKDISSPANGYTYQFKTTGIFTATFVAANSTIYGGREIVKTLQMTIVP